VSCLLAVAGSWQQTLLMKAHGIGHDKTDHSTAGQAVRAAGVKPADLVWRKENRDGMHVLGEGLAQLSESC